MGAVALLTVFLVSYPELGISDISEESERLVASWWIGAHSIFGVRERLPRLGEDRESIAHSSAQRCLCLLSDTRVMSLTSFLLPASKAKVKAIDKGLDDLFRASASVSLPGGLSGPHQSR